MTTEYLFTSERLGFRNWLHTDIPMMALINADPAVMKYFPALKTLEETKEFIERMQKQFAEKGYCYFAVDKLEDAEFIGFIGLSEQTFESPFTPCMDIGWRLACNEWNKGYATEGAERCLAYAFDDLRLGKINAVAPVVNLASEAVMKKIGMRKVTEFIHPLLLHDERLKACLLYEALRPADE